MRKIVTSSIKYFTLFTTYALSMLVVWFFVLMFINGGTVLLTCIVYGEQIIEYPMMAIFVPLLTYGTWLNYKELDK